MAVNLSGSLVITGSITTTGVILMSGSIASASYSSTSDLLQGTGSVGFATTASLLAVSSSQQQMSSSLLRISSSYASTGSNSFRADQSITGSLVVSSTITAQTLVVQTVTSSIVYSSGSNIFGSQITDRQTFTGSLNVTGSSHSIFGSLNIGTTSSVAGVMLNVQSVGNSAAILINNSSSAAYTGFRIYNDQVSVFRALEIDYAGSTYGGALLSSGITGESAAITTTGAYPLQFGTSNTFRMCILSGGNVGIGVTNPDQKLSIQAASGYGLISFKSSSAVTTAYIGISDTNSNVITTSTSGDLCLRVESTNSILFSTAGSTERMRIGSGGAVCIGMTSSAYGSVSVKSNSTTAYAGFNIYATGNGNFAYVNHDNNRGVIGTEYGSGGTGHTALAFESGGSERMRISTGGNISIGSTSAAYNFNVYGASAADGWGAFFGGAGNTKGGIYLGNAGTQYGTLYFDNANNNVVLKQSYATGTVNVIANTGGVTLANGGTSWAAISSDVRKKKNFETTQGLAEVLQIEPIKYHFKEDDNNSTKRLGFKAQNIQPLIPEMVLETGEIAEDGSPYLTVTPDYILPVLVKAIQELSAKVTALETK